MARKLVCESCGKDWRVECPPEVKVIMQSCLGCDDFKFHIEPTKNEKAFTGSVIKDTK